MLTTENLVNREVYACVSHLVATMAGGYGSVSRKTSTIELEESCEQAFELCTPVDDFEEAATQEGYKQSTIGFWYNGNQYGSEADALGAGDTFETARDVCDEYSIDPYSREIFEHWIVSDWLADKLAEKGEKVDKDFAGLIVWGRTTTGQGIANDWVIEQIVNELNAA